MNKITNIDWTKLARYLDHEMIEGEREEFENTIKSSEEYSKILDSVREKWIATKNKHKMIEVNTDSAWEKLKGRIEKHEMTTNHAVKELDRSDRSIFFYVLRIAAVLIVTAGLSLVIYRAIVNPHYFSHGQMIVKAEPDRMMQTTLPDGSVIHLKANSEIIYLAGKRGTRELKLKGEAYFDIVPDQGKPFIISSGPALIKVFGTSFSVESEESSQTVNVYVESGLVSLASKISEDQFITLEPGYLGILSGEGIRKEINRNENLLAWKTGKLEFRMKSLDAVVTDLNHTYGANIKLENEEIADCHFTGTFLDHQPVDTVLEVLETAFNLEIIRTQSYIVLAGPGCN